MQGGQTSRASKKNNEKDNSSKLSGSKGSNRGSSVDDSEEEEEIKLTKVEKRKIVVLTEAPRHWLSPFYNK